MTNNSFDNLEEMDQSVKSTGYYSPLDIKQITLAVLKLIEKLNF